MPSPLSRVKSFFESVCARITLTRITTFFFIFTFIHCFAQGIIQSFLYSVDGDYKTLVSGVVTAGRIPPGNVTFLEGSSGRLILRMCNDIPHGQPKYPCETIFNSSSNLPNIASVSKKSTNTPILVGWEDGLDISSVFALDNPSVVVGVTILSSRGTQPIVLKEQCVQNLVYAEQLLRNFKREDIALISLQFWLFAISVIAIVNDSVPHILTVLITRTLMTGWSMYAIWRTKHTEDLLREFLADPNTPCSLDFFTTYFWRRSSFEIADLVLNCTALAIAYYLSSSLLRVYRSQSFNCVGAPKHINRINRFFMAVLACLQLGVFVFVASMGMWTDVLLNTAIAKISEHTPVYQALFICTMILLLPWIAMGWYAIKREMRSLMALFLVIAFIILSGWSIMFYSIVYRWTFLEWPFLGCLTVASLILLLASMTLGLICHHNFGKGHAEYLRAEETLASSNFAQEVFIRDEEKEIMNLPISVPNSKHSSKHSEFDRHQATSVYYIETLRSDGEKGVDRPWPF